MREILFDTETTGFDPFSGDRVIEIGCVEMINKVLHKDSTFHVYINPERDVPAAAVEVHGLTGDFLADKPVFTDVVDGFLDFVGDDGILVAHNAEFDMKFINFELEKAGYPVLGSDRFVDTLAIARTKYPGQPNSLDALCRRLEIDNSHRSLHGALLDAEILAEVYLELTVGRQAGLDLSLMTGAGAIDVERKSWPKRSFPVSDSERAAHDAFVRNSVENAVWLK
ncbi:DNA polymerase III subunit epsilon [Eilatimonas milleporae]|uniref:DNA polymerase III subunit epsilon n=1 Tax=Eilatimonas milleporae TaxID=911205 RepID=A0A3M0BW65_9PROT|nr:DNA polymerase III subunit epsilon [Eilatimonas milleporae]RMB01834.1 DNA polymerase-3 subunit epsilon [Eilatimonas milleporae]